VATSEVGSLFYSGEFPNITGEIGAAELHDGRGITIAIDINRGDFDNYNTTLNKLMHEYIHAMQEIKYPIYRRSWLNMKPIWSTLELIN